MTNETDVRARLERLMGQGDGQATPRGETSAVRARLERLMQQQPDEQQATQPPAPRLSGLDGLDARVAPAAASTLAAGRPQMDAVSRRGMIDQGSLLPDGVTPIEREAEAEPDGPTGLQRAVTYAGGVQRGLAGAAARTVRGLDMMPVAPTGPMTPEAARMYMEAEQEARPERIDRALRGETIASQFADRIEKEARLRFPADPRAREEFVNQTLEGLGSAGMYLGAGAVSGGASLPVMGALGVLGSEGELLTEAREAGASSEDVLRANQLKVIAGGAIEALPIERALGRFVPKAMRGRIIDMAIGAAEEAGQEAVQSILMNWAVRESGIDPGRDIMDGVKDDATVGAAVGALINALIGAGASAHYRGQSSAPEPAQVLPTPAEEAAQQQHIMQALEAQGIDTSNQQAVETALNNPPIVAAVQEWMRSNPMPPVVPEGEADVSQVESDASRAESMEGLRRDLAEMTDTELQEAFTESMGSPDMPTESVVMLHEELQKRRAAARRQAQQQRAIDETSPEAEFVPAPEALPEAEAAGETDVQAGAMVGGERDVSGRLRSLYETSLNDPSSEEFVDFAPVSDQEAKLIQEATGIDVAGYVHVIDGSAVRHTIRSHGEASGEATRGQDPITVEDIARLPEIIRAPDRIEPAGPSPRGPERIRYVKRENGTTYIVEEARTGRRKLAVVTMYKRKSGGPDTPSGAPDFTSPPSGPAPVPSDGGTTPGVESSPAAPADGFGRIPFSDLAVDPGRFQVQGGERQQLGYAEESADRVAREFDEQQLDPLRVWQDPKDGKWYVLAGHSRHEGIRRRIEAGDLPADYQVPVHVFEGTAEEAAAFGRTENEKGTATAPSERAAHIREFRSAAETKKAVDEEARRLYGKDAKLVVDLSYLSPRGRAMQALAQFQGTSTRDADSALRMAQWIGAARRRFPDLTDSHEGELFDFLQKRYGKDAFTSTQSGWVEYVDGVIARRTSLFDGGFDPSQPLNIENIASKTQQERTNEEQIRAATKELADAKKALDAERKRRVAEGVAGEDLTRVLKEYDDAVIYHQRKLIELQNEATHAREANRAQGGLFDAFGITGEQQSRAREQPEGSIAGRAPVAASLRDEAAALESQASDPGQEGRIDEAFRRTTEAIEDLAGDIPDGASSDARELGLYAGRRALGWADARVEGRTFEGRYDQQQRFEIDDSGATLRREALPTEGRIARANQYLRDRHGVDTDKRGIGSRTVPQELQNEALTWADENAPSARLADVLDHAALYEAYPRLRDVRVEVRPLGGATGAFDPQRNTIMLDPGRLDADRSNEALRSTLLHEIQHWIQEHEGFARGGSPQAYAREQQIGAWRVRQINERLGELSRRIDRATGAEKEALREQYNSAIAERDHVREALRMQDDAVDLYRRTAGEIEARDVQARQDMTAEERAAAEPFSSENIAAEDAIVTGAGAEVARAVAPTERPVDPLNPGRGIPEHQLQTRLEGATGKLRTSAPKVIDAFSRVLEVAGAKVPIRTGRISKRRALGVFKVGPEVIRLLEANDIPTAAHEMAHALEKAIYGWPAGGPWKNPLVGAPVQRELVALGRALYGDTTPAGGYKREGWAEFVRMWVSRDADGLERQAPKLTAWFEGSFAEANPDVFKALEAARREVDTWREQGAVARVRESIIDPASPRSRAERWMDSVRDFFTMSNLVEMAQPLQQLSRAAEEALGRKLRPSEDPFATMTALRMTHSARAARMVTRGMIDIAGNTVGPSLAEIRTLVEGRYDDFIVYLYAQRAEALWLDEHGPRNPGITLEDAQQVLRELGSPEFELAAQKVYEWNDGVLNYAAQSSRHFKEVVDKIRERDPGRYVPLQREFDALAQVARGGGSKAARGNLVQRLVGSTRRIKDPFQAMIAQAEAMVRQSHERMIIEQVMELSQIEGLGHLIEEVPVDRVPVASRTVDELIGELNRHLEPEADVQVNNPFGEDLSGQIITFFAPAQRPTGGDPIFPVWEGGRVRWFEMNGELYDSLRSLDVFRISDTMGRFWGGITRWTLEHPAALFRAGTTGLRASFGLVTNPARDVQTLYVNTKSTANVGEITATVFKSFADAALHRATGRESAVMEAFLNLGGEMATSLGQDMPTTRRAARTLLQGRTVRTLDPRNWWDFYRDLVQTPEYAPRTAELKLVGKDIGWTPGEPMTLDQSIQLLTAAKQATVDFTAAGEFARGVNRVVPFFNVSIQGPRTVLRAAKRNPGLVAMRAFTLFAVPALALWWQHKDDEWWQELPYKDRVLYQHVPFTNPVTGAEEIARIPRAHETVFFNAMFVMLADAWYTQNPEEATAFFTETFDFMAPDVMPVLANVTAEQLANRKFFWDTPIDPRGEERLPPEERFNEYTSRAAIELGQIFKVSPRRIDHAIQGVAGPAAGDLLSVLGLGPEGIDRDKELADAPIVGRLFQRGGQAPARSLSVDRLYDALEEAQTKQASRRHEETDLERQQRLQLDDARKAVQALSYARSRTEKREDRDELSRVIAEIARDALAMHEGGQIQRGRMQGRRRAAEMLETRTRREEQRRRAADMLR